MSASSQFEIQLNLLACFSLFSDSSLASCARICLLMPMQTQHLAPETNLRLARPWR
jgi:hypothetical protein